MPNCLYKLRLTFKGLTMLEMIISLAMIAVIFAALLPQFRNIQNSWASKQAGAEAVQNGRILISYLNQNLVKAARITAVSDPCDTNGYIEFEDNTGATIRCDIGANKYVQYGNVAQGLFDLAGPVSKLQFTCYALDDLDTPTTDVETIRLVKVETTLINSAPLGQDKNFTTKAYLRINASVASGLIGLWRFDETSGLTAADSSSYGNNGTLVYMGGSRWTTGLVDGALDFDGYNDHVDCGNDTELQLTSELTIAAWIKADAWTYGRYVNIIARKGTTTPVNYQLCIADEKVMLGLDDMDENAGVRGDTLLATGLWYHVAATWDGKKVRIYVDGILDNFPPDARPGTIGTDTRPLYLGGRLGEDYFDGIIDNVRIYGRALGDDEIAQLAGTRAGVVGYWKFDETGGSSAADSSGNDFDATVSGGIWEAGGYIDGALDFDGNDDYVDTTIDSDSLELVTFCTWFRSDDAGSIGDDDVAQRFVTQMRTSSGTRFALGINNDKVAVYWRDPSGSNVGEGTTTLSPGQWYHAAVTYDGSRIRLYLDGNEEDSFNESNMRDSTTSTTVQIGRHVSSRYFDGLLDEVRIYHRALTEPEIQAIYNQSEYCCSIGDEILP